MSKVRMRRPARTTPGFRAEARSHASLLAGKAAKVSALIPIPAVACLILATACLAHAQSLPDMHQLLEKVQANQRQLDLVREQYTFREQQMEQELNKHGSIEKQHSHEYEVFYVHGHPIQKLVRRDGSVLSASDATKEAAHIQQKIELAEKTPPGELLNSRHQVSVARLLTIERFTNERRVSMDNRPMIAVDFQGDNKAQTHGIAEDASKHLSGTVWIDEHDVQVRRVQATVDSTFRLEFGLLSLSPGSSFTFDQKIINNEVWLPTSATIHVEAHAAFFLGYHIDVHITDDQYRKFKANAETQENPAAKP